MSNEYQWIPESLGNVGNMLGLNPKAAAEGRRLQAGAEYDSARTRNLDAETSIVPLKGEKLKAEASSHSANADKLKSEKGLHDLAAAGRRGLADLFSSGAMIRNSDGSVTISPDAANRAASFLSMMEGGPNVVMQGVRETSALASSPRAAAQTRGTAGALEPDASFSAAEGEKIQANKENASLARVLAARNGEVTGASANATRAADLENEVVAAIDLVQPDMDQEWKDHIMSEAMKRVSSTVGPKTAVRQAVAALGSNTTWEDDKNWVPGTSYSPRNATHTGRVAPGAWNPPAPAAPSTVAQAVAPAPAAAPQPVPSVPVVPAVPQAPVPPAAVPAVPTAPAAQGRPGPSQRAIDLLRQNPSLASQFDQTYGPGASQAVLGSR